jgi:adenine-specific DNA-methyltransferase
LSDNGVLSFIVPSTLIADKNTQGIRLSFKEKGSLKFLIEFPEKEKVFESVTQATTVFLFKQGAKSDSFKLSVGLNSAVLPPESFALIKWHEVEELFGESLTFPLIKSESELTIMKAIRNGAQPLAKVIKCYRGDINLGTYKDSVRSKPTGQLLVRGEHIQEYFVDLSDKNTDRRWFETKEVFSGVSRSRVVSQHIANMGLRKRLIASIIPENIVVGDSANCFEPISEDLSQKTILALLNSNLLNWYYKKLSTNNNVNIYEMDELPIRPFSRPQQKKVETIVDKLMKIKRESMGNSSLNAELSSLQKEIDSMVYDLYEVSEEFRLVIDLDITA